MIVAVMGPHRSGTSVVASLIRSMGASVASDGSADRWNPRGYHENIDVVSINEDILLLGGGSWHRPWLFSPSTALRAAQSRGLGDEIRATTMKACVARRMDQRVTLFKDPRFCLTLPFWQLATQATRRIEMVVRTSRNREESARSLVRRENGWGLPFARRVTDAYAYHASMLGAYVTVDVDFNALMKDPAGEAHRLEDALKQAAEASGRGEGVWTRPIDPDCVDASLWRNRA